MVEPFHSALKSAIFITFSGNCRKALTFYQGCIGGKLYFETFQMPSLFPSSDVVLCGSLISETMVIHGSDLVHDEGRRSGNHISIYLLCKCAVDRKMLINKLGSGNNYKAGDNLDEQKLVEITDPFDVRWMLGI